MYRRRTAPLRGCMLALVCALTTAAPVRRAAAQVPAREPSPPADAPLLSDGRLELGTALASRRATLRDEALPASFGGFAPAHLRIAGAAFLRDLPWGARAELTHDWFTAVGSGFGGGDGETRVPLAATSFSVAGVARWRPRPVLAVEGHLGYDVGALPLLDASSGEPKALSLRYHGPRLALAVEQDDGGPLAARLSAHLMPVALGGDSARGATELARAGLAAQVAAGGWRWADVRWHAVADWALDWARGSTGGTSLSQSAMRFGLGLRASFGDVPARAAAPVGAAAPGADARAADAAPAAAELPSGPGRIVGAVRLASAGKGAAPGGPAAGVVVESPGRPAVRTDAEGRFVLEAVGPGPVALTLRSAGRRTVQEVVQVPPGGDVPLEVELQRTTRGAPAWLKGQVRSAGGPPLAGVTLRVEGTRASARTDAQGRFELRVRGGRYTVHFAAPGHLPQSKSVEVEDGDQVLFYVHLSPEEG